MNGWNRFTETFFNAKVMEKYLPETRREEALKELLDDPKSVMVVLHPEKILP